MRIDRKKLAIAMIERDLDVNSLANATQLSRGTISGVKNGRSCNEDTAIKIANALGKELNELQEV